MTRPGLSAIVLLLLVGCAADPDGDGLKSGEEKDLGLDPKVADSDGDGLDDGAELDAGADPLNTDSDADGLLDGEEITNGSDPTVVDTDEDTYTDFDEVQTGHSPADPEDRIYQGYWPYNPAKDELGDGSQFDGMPAEVGEQFPRFDVGKDQYRDVVDLYDFAGRSYVILDASASWCGPCQDTAAWLSGEEDSAMEDAFGRVRKAVNRGEIAWVTILTDGWDGTATQADIREWDRTFPNEHVPVLSDPNGDVLLAINYDGEAYLFWPSFVVLDANMEVMHVGGLSDSLSWVDSHL